VCCLVGKNQTLKKQALQPLLLEHQLSDVLSLLLLLQVQWQGNMLQLLHTLLHLLAHPQGENLQLLVIFNKFSAFGVRTMMFCCEFEVLWSEQLWWSFWWCKSSSMADEQLSIVVIYCTVVISYIACMFVLKCCWNTVKMLVNCYQNIGELLSKCFSHVSHLLFNRLVWNASKLCLNNAQVVLKWSVTCEKVRALVSFFKNASLS
jgi:hypothetical protein